MKPNLKLSSVKKKDDVQFIFQKETKNKIHSIGQDKKINILLAPTLNDQLYSHVESNPQNSSFKQYITKISPSNQLCTNSLNASLGTKQCMLPITIKNDGSPDKQIIAHINTKSLMLPTYQLQMKVCIFLNIIIISSKFLLNVEQPVLKSCILRTSRTIKKTVKREEGRTIRNT